MALIDDLRSLNMMKIDGFLEVPDIAGPSQRDGHEDQIEIYDVTFSMVAPFDPNSLSRKGRVSLGTLTCTKDVDMSSPYLAKACHENKPLDEVVIYCRRTIDGATSFESDGGTAPSLQGTPEPVVGTPGHASHDGGNSLWGWWEQDNGYLSPDSESFRSIANIVANGEVLP